MCKTLRYDTVWTACQERRDCSSQWIMHMHANARTHEQRTIYFLRCHVIPTITAIMNSINKRRWINQKSEHNVHYTLTAPHRTAPYWNDWLTEKSNYTSKSLKKAELDYIYIYKNIKWVSIVHWILKKNQALFSPLLFHFLLLFNIIKVRSPPIPPACTMNTNT